jgi:hypothetical protein
MWRFRRLFGISIFLLVGAPFGARGASTCCEGDWWLAWKVETQRAYVLAMMEGYQSGFAKGCDAAMQLANGNYQLYRRCLAKAPKLLNNAEDYVTLLTRFYNDYPGDRRIAIKRVMLSVVGGDSTKATPAMLHDRFNRRK